MTKNGITVCRINQNGVARDPTSWCLNPQAQKRAVTDISQNRPQFSILQQIRSIAQLS
ncbi:hypothetical protein V1264_002123 [Littorina saxatilis]|uniref:Uncharacterized protein n=1 Tax=Littorina saxatilis TaxID=31220 RepID=A0AAN9C3B9_9CAEN